MKLSELLAQLRAASGRALSFQDSSLEARWASGDGSADLEAAAPAEDGKPALPKFTLRAYNGGLLEIGWGSPVVVDLAGMQISAKPRPILKDHLAAQVVGHSTEAINNLKNLILKGIASGTGPAAIEVIGNAKNGFPWQASIGCRVIKAQFIPEKQTVEANGRTFKGPCYYVPESSLQEVSFVALGGDDTTSALVASRQANPSTKEQRMHPEFKKWLEASGFAIDTLTEPAIAKLQASWEAETATAAKTGDLKAGAEGDPIAAVRARSAAEVERLDAIHQKAKDFPKIEAQAIREGWTVDRTELAVLRASRPQGTGSIVSSTPSADTTPKVLEAAACMALGLKGEHFEKGYDERTLEAASRMRNIGLQDILIAAATANGYSARLGAIRSDLAGVLRAAFSSSDIAGILSNTANKFIMESFLAVEQTWRQIAAVRPARDFKTMTSYRLTGALQYEKVGATGEIPHGELGNDSYTNKVDTHAKMLGITRQDIINDDLGALQKVPSLLGRGAALQLNEVFWTEFLASLTSFYTTGRGNRQDGAGTVLSIDSLTAAELLFFNQTDSNGKPLGIAPKFLLTPNALNATAAQLTKSLELRDTTANTKFGVSNPHAGKFEPIRSAYLNNAKISNGSATHWFLIADPRELAVIEVAFLNGIETPTIETAEADFNVLGVQMRGYHDFGVAKQEYRAAVISKGAA
jgi:hypothetical protein